MGEGSILPRVHKKDKKKKEKLCYTYTNICWKLRYVGKSADWILLQCISQIWPYIMRLLAVKFGPQCHNNSPMIFHLLQQSPISLKPTDLLRLYIYIYIYIYIHTHTYIHTGMIMIICNLWLLQWKPTRC